MVEVIELGGAEAEPAPPPAPSPWPSRTLVLAVVVLAAGSVLVGRWRSEPVEATPDRPAETAVWGDVEVQVVRRPTPGSPQLVLDVTSPDGTWDDLTLELGRPPLGPDTVFTASPVAALRTPEVGTMIAVSVPAGDRSSSLATGGLVNDHSLVVFRARADTGWTEVVRWEGLDAWPVELGSEVGFVGTGSGLYPGLVVAHTVDGRGWIVELPTEGRGFIARSAAGVGTEVEVTGFLDGAPTTLRSDDAGATWSATEGWKPRST